MALSIVILFSATGGVARAGDDFYCVNQVVAAGAVCYGPSHTLTSNMGTNLGSGPGCAGALSVGSYYCATPTGCHTYSSQLLTPGIRHKSTTTSRTMYGEQTYGSTLPTSGCVASVPYAVAGPVDEASAYLAGVPVLDRSPVKAPDAVAALIPSANAKLTRTFDTPHGRGWVLVDPSIRSVCVVVDDAGTGYGMSCQRYGAARDQGSIETLEDDDATTADGDLVIALMPAGVVRVVVETAGGGTREVQADAGIVVTTLSAKDRAVDLEVSPNADAGVAPTRMAMVVRRPKARHR